jgi:hypothetical protein
LAQVVPVQANASDTANTINGGLYSWHLDIIGAGFTYTYERAPAAAPAPVADPPKAKPASPEKEPEAEAEATPEDAEPAKDAAD